MIWYQQKTEDLYHILDSSERGLPAAESRKRLLSYGPNKLAMKKTPFWKIIIEPFLDVFVAVLVFAALVSLWNGEKLDAIIIAAIIFIDAAIFWSQQYATSRVLRSLRKHSVSEVRIMRAGREISVSSELLVPGDILLLAEGERIPADARVLREENLQLNESALTGESTPVAKSTITLNDKKEVYEQENMLFQGTYVLTGTGVAIVVETGGRTEFGKIAQLASETGDEKSPVQAKIDTLIMLLMKITAGIAIIVFVLAILRGIPTAEAIRFVLSLSVSAVPEGLPVALTVIIVLGMRRMAAQNALVRSFKAIEDIGLLTTIATDKTGTLTKNRLTIVESWDTGDDDSRVAAFRTLEPESVTDPLDIAIVQSNPNRKTHIGKLYPFDLALRLSGAFSTTEKKLYIKGAPEKILAVSNASDIVKKTAEQKMLEYAQHGFRVIAVAAKLVEQPPEDLTDSDGFELIGLIALADELRAEAAGAIAEARAAGISVRLITGDHLETAYHIGHTVGLAEKKEQVIAGTGLPKSVTALASVIRDKTVFARILPEDKFKILKALKKHEIVAMTGDGVNDVPALAGSHIGFAMGSGDSAGYFDMANKDALTRRVAAINAEIEANPYYLEQNCLTKAYDAAMDVLTTLYVSQADVDAALADLPDPPVGHQLTAVEKVPATCETAGVEAYWKCSVCGKLFSDAEGKTETTLEKLAIPATGHAYGAPVWKWNDDFTAAATITCGNDASHVETVNAAVTNEVTTEATCEADGVRTYTAKVTFEGKDYTDTKTETLPATGHDTELVGAKDATCTEDGYTGNEVCKVCQTVVKQGEVIPALGHDYKDGKCSRCGAEEPTTPVEPGKPATGDSSTLVLWLALLAISGMAVTVIPSRKKRSR